MISAEKLKKINELAKKSKKTTLNAIEKEEQKQLRKEYLENFRKSFRKQLESIEFVDEKSN